MNKVENGMVAQDVQSPHCFAPFDTGKSDAPCPGRLAGVNTVTESSLD